ncbi:MAG TPA: DUF5916 domain-containing protein [Longimicrobium sp.]|nr:DUF5916 domain-containing protein [Longimicrobium sp.]
MPFRHSSRSLLALALLAAGPLCAQAPLAVAPQPASSPVSLDAPRVMRAVRTAEAPRIDGRFDEAAWATAEVATDFVQRQPQPGEPSSERTEVRLLYDDGAVYVAARMFDRRPDSMQAPLARRDQPVANSEWFNVVLDSYHDRRTAFRFGVNPAGLRRDVYHFNDGADDPGWDAVWEVATTVDDQGWTAEFRIPLSQLRFNPPAAGAEQSWGVQFFRYVSRRDEWSHWAPWLPTYAGFVSRFGELRGIAGLRAPRRLELMPYSSARLDRQPPRSGDPFYSQNEATGSVGLDVKMGVTSGLTLTGTVNPDFGQVELDPAVVNLTAFETQFAERRPFFVEGADIFRFGQTQAFNGYGNPQFFYSRRVGRAPQRRVFPGGDAPFVDEPEQSTILAAAKVSGRTAGGWSVGVMDAVTQREQARYVDAEGLEHATPVEPMTNYFIGRVRRDLNGGATTVGGMVTAVNRDLADDELVPLLRRDAYVGGIDFEHAWARRLWTVSGHVAASRVGGSADAIARTQRSSARYYQRPDAEHLELDPERTSLAGTSAALAVQRSGDWDMSVQLRQVTPGWEMNDMGFAPRSDLRSLATFLGRRVPRPNRVFRQYSTAVYTTHAWNTGGDATFADLGLGLNGIFHNLWNAGLNLSYEPETRDDRLTRGGPLAASPASWGVNAYFSSDPRRRLSLSASGYAGGDRAGGADRSASVSLNLRPSASVQASVGSSLSLTRDPDQYLFAAADPAAAETFGTRYVFGRLEQTTASMDLRLDWTFTPTVSLQLFAQPFVAAGDFRDFREFTTPGESRYAVYGRDRGTVCTYQAGGGRVYAIQPTLQVDCPAGAENLPGDLLRVDDPDFNVRSLRGNAVLRWEYRPGSALFLVWQQERSGFEPLGGFSAGRDVGRLFREPARNVFLLKATYWIG